MTDLAEHLAAIGLDHRRGVALERMTEGVVGGEEEPGVAAGLDDRLAGAVGQHPGVVGPVHGVGRALGPVRSDEAAPESMNTLFLFVVISLTASATPEFGTSTIMSTFSTSYHWLAMLEPTSGLFW